MQSTQYRWSGCINRLIPSLPSVEDLRSVLVDFELTFRIHSSTYMYHGHYSLQYGMYVQRCLTAGARRGGTSTPSYSASNICACHEKHKQDVSTSHVPAGTIRGVNIRTHNYTPMLEMQLCYWRWTRAYWLTHTVVICDHTVSRNILLNCMLKPLSGAARKWENIRLLPQHGHKLTKTDASEFVWY